MLGFLLLSVLKEDPFPLKSIMGLPWWSSGENSALLMQEVQVQFLVRELRSHMPLGMTKKKKKIKIIINQKYDGGCYEKSAEMLPLDCSPSIVFLQIFITSRE